MKILKTFQPFVILIALTIHQTFFITLTSSKISFNISGLMYESKIKDDDGYSIPSLSDIYTLAGLSSDRNESSLVDFVSDFLAGRSSRETKDGRDRHKNRLRHSVSPEKTLYLLTRKKRTKMSKKYRAEYRHMRKKSSRSNESGKTDYSKNRYKRTTLGGYERYSKGGAMEYKLKDSTVSEVSEVDATEKIMVDSVVSHLISADHPAYGSYAKRDAVTLNDGRVARKMKWPNKRVVSVEGDVIIGGLMMVHSRGEGDMLCGPVMAQGGVQALEVMLYTLNVINKNPRVPFKIGAHILDDCDTDTYGLEMALDFIKANLHYLDDGAEDTRCVQVTKPIWGVVGAPSSITSIQVSNLLRLFKIPMISPFSTSPELSNKHKYDYFSRTIPSDYYQVQVIAKIIDRLEWTYVSVIYEESNYGIKGLEELEKVLNERKICVAIKEKVLKDSGVPNESFYDKVVDRLLTKPLAKGVIVFASDQEVAGIMRAVKRLNITNRFSWIGSDGWSARNLVSDGNEDVVEGTISVQPQAQPVRGFNEYFFKRKPNDFVNPYFAEFWETHFQCRLPFVPDTPFNENLRETCRAEFQLGLDNVEIENQLQFVHQATHGFCQALIDMHADLCGREYRGVCQKMSKKRGSLFLEYIRKVNFTDFSGDEFEFDKNGDGPARYNVVHYKQTSPGVYKWIKIGKYENGELNLNLNDLQFKLNELEMPVSSCSEICEKGEVKKYINGDKCCWKCTACSKNDVVLATDETECTRCTLGFKPAVDRRSCVELEPLTTKSEFFTLSITGTAAFGFFNVVTTFMIYMCNFNTAIVRAASREAQILVLCGALLLHANAYSFLLDPNEVVCSMQSYFSGIGYILIYGTLFWKSYRIVRIFDLSSQYKNMNSSAFVLLVLGLCCIQKIKSVVWTYFVDPRKVANYYPDEDTRIKLCSAFTTWEIGYFIAYIFPLTSIIFCYLRTKKITNTPKIFNDSPQIFFSIRFTLISWIAMFVMHFMTSDILLRENILAIITNLNGIVIVFALFYRSMFIILFRPHLNTREYLRASRANHIMKSCQNDGSQQVGRETISQLVMNELSGECSYNIDTAEHDSKNSNERECARKEISVQVPEYTSPRSRTRSSSVNTTKVEMEKYDKAKRLSESNVANVFRNNESSDEAYKKQKCYKNGGKLKKSNNREEFSSSESIHELYVEQKPVEEDVEDYRICSETSSVASDAQDLPENQNAYLDSNAVFFKMVACVEANSSEVDYMSLIFNSKDAVR